MHIRYITIWGSRLSTEMMRESVSYGEENNQSSFNRDRSWEFKIMTKLEPLQTEDREQFILDNQEAFNYGALEEFGLRDDHMEEDGQIISRDTIERSIDSGEAYRIINDGEKVGGAVIKVDGNHGELELLFVSPEAHSKGIGYAAWCEIEKIHPEVDVWETVTPYFEKRNIHFYVNRCGFHIVEFYNEHHPDPKDQYDEQDTDDRFQDGMFRFEKKLTKEIDDDIIDDIHDPCLRFQK